MVLYGPSKLARLSSLLLSMQRMEGMGTEVATIFYASSRYTQVLLKGRGHWSSTARVERRISKWSLQARSFLLPFGACAGAMGWWALVCDLRGGEGTGTS